MTQFNHLFLALWIGIIVLVLFWGYVRHNKRKLQMTGAMTPFYEKWTADPKYNWTLVVIIVSAMVLLIAVA